MNGATAQMTKRKGREEGAGQATLSQPPFCAKRREKFYQNCLVVEGVLSALEIRIATTKKRGLEHVCLEQYLKDILLARNL